MATWLGYEFEEYRSTTTTTWHEVAGLYVFVRQRKEGEPDEPLYVGQTDSFRARLPNHPQWDAALHHGANRIDARVEKAQGNRAAIEQTLIRGLQPPMNVLLR